MDNPRFSAPVAERVTTKAGIQIGSAYTRPPPPPGEHAELIQSLLLRRPRRSWHILQLANHQGDATMRNEENGPVNVLVVHCVFIAAAAVCLGAAYAAYRWLT